MTKRQLYILAFAILILALILWFFWDKIFPKKETCPNGKAIPIDGNCAAIMSAAEIIDYNKPATSNGGVTPKTCKQPLSYILEAFPLAIGMQGENVKKLQAYLGGILVDGKFGCNTQAAVLKKIGTKDIDETTFNLLFIPVSNPIG